MLEKSIKNLMEIVSLSEDEIKKNDRNVSAILDLEDLKSLKELLDYFKENKLDLTTVYLKGVYDGKEQATADLTITKEKLAEDTFKENIKLKKELEEENKKKDKIIDLMTEHIVSSAIVDDTVCAIKCDCETDIEEDCTHEKMLNCTKQYFKSKEEKE